jgi:hypothetical protein
MQLSVVHNLILVEFSDWFATSGLLVIDAVGWRSIYLVVMPIVNLIAILSTYARCLYSINCPTVICLPSMCYFILWRDTTSELWTPVLFPFILLSLIYFTRIVYFTRILLLLSTRYAHSFVYSKPVRLTTSSQVWNKIFGCVVCRFHVATSWRRANKISLMAPLLECH